MSKLLQGVDEAREAFAQSIRRFAVDRPFNELAEKLGSAYRILDSRPGDDVIESCDQLRDRLLALAAVFDSATAAMSGAYASAIEICDQIAAM